MGPQLGVGCRKPRCLCSYLIACPSLDARTPQVPEFDSYKERILQCLSGKPRPAEETLSTSTYVRDGNRIVGVRKAAAAPTKPPSA